MRWVTPRSFSRLPQAISDAAPGPHRSPDVDGSRARRPAIAGFRERAPGIALTLRAAPFAEGLRLLLRGDSDLHYGGADPGDPLPARTLPRHRPRHGLA